MSISRRGTAGLGVSVFLGLMGFASEKTWVAPIATHADRTPPPDRQMAWTGPYFRSLNDINGAGDVIGLEPTRFVPCDVRRCDGILDKQ